MATHLAIAFEDSTLYFPMIKQSTIYSLPNNKDKATAQALLRLLPNTQHKHTGPGFRFA